MSSWFESVTEKLIHCRGRFVQKKGSEGAAKQQLKGNNMEHPLKTNKDEKVLDVLVLIITWHRFVSKMEVLIINLGL